MDENNSIVDSVIVTKGAAKKKVEKSFVVNIRQGTSKKEILDLLREYQLKNYKVTDVRVSTLRPLDNSLPYVLDIAFAKSDIAISSSIIELPFLDRLPLVHLFSFVSDFPLTGVRISVLLTYQI
jgi:hypothetical protein